jgi:hypothetical protein
MTNGYGADQQPQHDDLHTTVLRPSSPLTSNGSPIKPDPATNLTPTSLQFNQLPDLFESHIHSADAGPDMPATQLVISPTSEQQVKLELEANAQMLKPLLGDEQVVFEEQSESTAFNIGIKKRKGSTDVTTKKVLDSTENVCLCFVTEQIAFYCPGQEIADYIFKVKRQTSEWQG